MSFLTNIYNKTVEENERNLRFWEDYQQNLKSLNFSIYSDNLRVPVLVPVGSRIFFKGDIKHTNEVTVSLGADYFAKCSIKQAEVLREHRIKDAQGKINMFRKEKEYLENQILFSKQNLFEQQGQEIVEIFTEEEEQAWREKHRENMQKYKQACKQEEKEQDVTDEELWQRLEELEIQEELESEFQGMNNEDLDSSGSNESFIVKDDEEVTKQIEGDKNNPSIYEQAISYASNNIMEQNVKLSFRTSPQTSKLDLLQQVIDRQNELESRLHEMKNRDRSLTKTENDLLSRLDEIEQLEDIEDEMVRLDDVLESEHIQETVDAKAPQSNTIKRQVTFADDDDSQTLELTFSHSDVQPDKSPYDVNKGIQKPSDIYEAYPNSLKGSTSILKKSKYEISKTIVNRTKLNANNVTTYDNQTLRMESEELHNPEPNESIVIKDVVERIEQSENKLASEARPTSLFKKKRMQKIS